MRTDHDYPGFDRLRRLSGGHASGGIAAFSARAVAASTAASAMVFLLSYRLLVNSPLELGWLVTMGTPLERTAVGLTGVAAIVVGLLADDWRVLLGLVTVGVFGILTVLAPPAGIPAAGAVIAGGILVVSTGIRTRPRRHTIRRAVVSSGVLGGAVLALGAAVGLLPAESRAIGSMLFVIGLATTPLLVSPTPVAWASGGLVAAMTLLAAISVPFLTGAALLVAWAVVGVSALLVAVGFGGIATVALTAVIRREPMPAAGAVLLFATGVPATSGRAVAAVLGLALLILPLTTTGDTS